MTTNDPSNPSETETPEPAAPRPPADTPRVGTVSIMFLGTRLIRPEVLSAMWAAGKWRYPCPKGCGGTLYVHGFNGSPFSGSGCSWGECTVCGFVSANRNTVPWGGIVLGDGLKHGEVPDERDPDPAVRLAVDLMRPRRGNPFPPPGKRRYKRARPGFEADTPAAEAHDAEAPAANTHDADDGE